MTTTWTGSPVLSAASINELRQAVDAAGGTPATGWTDGTPLSSTAALQPGYFTELRDAIQTLWNKDDRKLGLIPNWTGQAEPGLPTPVPPFTPIWGHHVTDLRK